MAAPYHLRELKKGPESWNRWRAEHLGLVPDLIDANLDNAFLVHANLSRANLRGATACLANLRMADLGSAMLDEATLSMADLSLTNLRRAGLQKAKLCGANLVGANLTQADLRHADLSGAYLFQTILADDRSGLLLKGCDFNSCELLSTVFADLDLRGVRNIDKCIHQGPSVIDHCTLAKSPDLPLVFLRGCGLPDNFIENIPGLFHVGPIQFYSCFISYSGKDQAFAERVHADLQDDGVRCWFAPEDVQGGKKPHEQIDEAIRVHEKLLLILSKNSMGSEWVKTELAKARRREVKEHKRVLFPISLVSYDEIREWECFDADTGKDSAREIREYFIPDFTNWKNHADYQKAFDRLLHDLKQG